MNLLPAILAFAQQSWGAVAENPLIPGISSAVAFVDLQTVSSRLTINARNLRAHVQSILRFKVSMEGRPFLNIPRDATDIEIIGAKGKIEFERFHSIEPSMSGLERNGILLPETQQGNYEIRIGYYLNNREVLSFDSTGLVDYFTRMTDLPDSKWAMHAYYIESTFPTTLQYAQYRFDVEIEIKESPISYSVLSNGDCEKKAPNRFHLRFPDSYVASSFFIHIFNSQSYQLRKFSLRKADGRRLPFEIECLKGNNSACDRAIDAVKILLPKYEAAFGSYPHKRLIMRLIDGDNRFEQDSGMEYSGAILTSNYKLAHELAHMWFGRSVYMRSGSDSWLSEALATWIAERFDLDPQGLHEIYQHTPLLEIDFQSLLGASRRPFSQYTSPLGYTQGRDLISYLDDALLVQGGLLPVLNSFHRKFHGKVITDVDFARLVLDETVDPSRRKLIADRILPLQ